MDSLINTTFNHESCIDSPYEFSEIDSILGSVFGIVISVLGSLFNGITIIALLRFKTTR